MLLKLRDKCVENAVGRRLRMNVPMAGHIMTLYSMKKDHLLLHMVLIFKYQMMQTNTSF